MGYNFFGLLDVCFRIAQLIVSIFDMKGRKKSAPIVLSVCVSVKIRDTRKLPRRKR